MYIVECTRYACEAEVYMANTEFGPKLVSPADSKFKKGYAEKVNREMTNPF